MITYSKAYDYARTISWLGYEDQARDLLHDAWLDLARKGVNLFEQSKRFVWLTIQNVNLNQRANSMEGRHRVHFTDISQDYQLYSPTPDPLQTLIIKELSETLSPELRLKVEGYSNREIGKMVGRTGQAIGHRIKLQTEKLK